MRSTETIARRQVGTLFIIDGTKMIDAKKHKQQVDDDDDDEEDYDEDEGGFEEAQSAVYRDLVRSTMFAVV